MLSLSLVSHDDWARTRADFQRGQRCLWQLRGFGLQGQRQQAEGRRRRQARCTYLSRRKLKGGRRSAGGDMVEVQSPEQWARHGRRVSERRLTRETSLLRRRSRRAAGHPAQTVVPMFDRNATSFMPTTGRHARQDYTLHFLHAPDTWHCSILPSIRIECTHNTMFWNI